MRTRSTFSTGSRLARQWSYWHQDRATRPPIHASRFRADATASFQLRRGGMRTPGESPAFFFMRVPRISEYRGRRVHQRKRVGLGLDFELAIEPRTEMLEGRQRGQRVLRLGRVVVHEMHEG